MSLKGKKILITAGPTWVAIDSVRVVSNIATGETGILLAKEAQGQGARVTLVMGPADICCLDKTIKVLRFKFFDELKDILLKEMRFNKYDAVIHSAAVADYRPQKKFKGKLDSRQKNVNLKMVATPKLLDLFKKIDRSLFLAAFKFEPQAKTTQLILKAKKLFNQSEADLIVANTFDKGNYRAYIVTRQGISGALLSKRKMAQKLMNKIGEADA